ncbi:HNH endonuclease signature motif containing protein [Streptomyces sp. NPDC050636]|uniref:HNH endonuclease signature motif containing protein n=1 Tax=Streptomyces sp. NPDC050636 TaxID=3154510 RepID=UPI003436F5C3
MPVKYTRERLTEAARASTSYDEAVRWFGGTPTPGSRRYLRARMMEAGVDTAHFAPARVRHTEARLRELVACSHSIADVVRRLGLDPVGGQHTHISRRIRSLGIDTSHFSPQGRRKTKARRRCSPEALLVEEENPVRRVPSSRLKCAMLALGAQERCGLCGTGPVWRNRPLPLEVDHIDGNWRNNRRENLRLLCPNCHSATDSYRGRNKRIRAARAGAER